MNPLFLVTTVAKKAGEQIVKIAPKQCAKELGRKVVTTASQCCARQVRDGVVMATSKKVGEGVVRTASHCCAHSFKDEIVKAAPKYAAKLALGIPVEVGITLASKAIVEELERQKMEMEQNLQ